MVNSPLIRPYFLGGGGIGGVPLDSHEKPRFWDLHIGPIGRQDMPDEKSVTVDGHENLIKSE